MPFAISKDGAKIHYRIYGNADAPALWVGYPWSDDTVEASRGGLFQTEEEIVEKKREYRDFISILSSRFKVVDVDYPRGTNLTDPPRSNDVLPDTVANDFLAVADHARIDRMVLVGYSWSANTALQVADRTDRVAGLAIGGWSPINGHYQELYDLLVAQRKFIPEGFDPSAMAMTDQIINYYHAVISQWDEATALEKLRSLESMLYCYVGAEDRGAPTVGLDIPIGETVSKNKDALKALGWSVDIMPGIDHINLDERETAGRILQFFEGKAW